LTHLLIRVKQISLLEGVMKTENIC